MKRYSNLYHFEMSIVVECARRSGFEKDFSFLLSKGIERHDPQFSAQYKGDLAVGRL